MATTKKHARKNGTAKQIGRYIVADPKICHGALTFRGTRIFVSDILSEIARGWSFERIQREWEGSVPPQAISEAVELARKAFLKHAVESSRPLRRRAAG